MIIIAIIVSGACFTLGNVLWPLFNEPKVFYVPLAIFLFLLVLYVKQTAPKEKKTWHILLEWLLLLAAGNIIKQLFYTETIKQVNDYVWGALLTINLTHKLFLQWANRSKQ